MLGRTVSRRANASAPAGADAVFARAFGQLANPARVRSVRRLTRTGLGEAIARERAHDGQHPVPGGAVDIAYGQQGRLHQSGHARRRRHDLRGIRQLGEQTVDSREAELTGKHRQRCQ